MRKKPFPSVELLRTLSASDQAFFVQMEYEDIKAEIAGLVSGYIKPQPPETKESRLDAARMRLKELQKIAGEFRISL